MRMLIYSWENANWCNLAISRKQIICKSFNLNMLWRLHHKVMHTFAQGGIQKYLCQHSFLIAKIGNNIQFSSVQSLSCVWLFATPWIAAQQASLSITNFWSLLKLMSIKLVMSSSHLTLCRPLHLLPPIPPSIGDFSNESTLRKRSGRSPGEGHGNQLQYCCLDNPLDREA